jgi:hypothetical protein
LWPVVDQVDLHLQMLVHKVVAERVVLELLFLAEQN